MLSDAPWLPFTGRKAASTRHNNMATFLNTGAKVQQKKELSANLTKKSVKSPLNRIEQVASPIGSSRLTDLAKHLKVFPQLHTLTLQT
jgi:hypothetical protein